MSLEDISNQEDEEKDTEEKVHNSDNLDLKEDPLSEGEILLEDEESETEYIKPGSGIYEHLKNDLLETEYIIKEMYANEEKIRHIKYRSIKGRIYTKDELVFSDSLPGQKFYIDLKIKGIGKMKSTIVVLDKSRIKTNWKKKWF